MSPLREAPTDVETVPCETCGEATTMKLCNLCWGIQTHFQLYLQQGGAKAINFIGQVMADRVAALEAKCDLLSASLKKRDDVPQLTSELVDHVADRMLAAPLFTGFSEAAARRIQEFRVLAEVAARAVLEAGHERLRLPMPPGEPMTREAPEVEGWPHRLNAKFVQLLRDAGHALALDEDGNVWAWRPVGGFWAPMNMTRTLAREESGPPPRPEPTRMPGPGVSR